MGCEGSFNYTKFKRPQAYNARFCIDPENEYTLLGNWDTKETKMFSINIERCDRTKS